MRVFPEIALDRNLGNELLGAVRSGDWQNAASVSGLLVTRIHMAARDADAVPTDELLGIADRLRESWGYLSRATDPDAVAQGGRIDLLSCVLNQVIADRALVDPLRDPLSRKVMEAMSNDGRPEFLGVGEIVGVVPDATEEVVRRLIETGYLFASIRDEKRLRFIRVTPTGSDAIEVARHILPAA